MEKIRPPNKPKSLISHGSKKPLDINTESKMADDEQKIILDLKKLYMDTIKLDVDLQHQIYILEKNFETKHAEIFEKRRKIIEDYKKKSSGGDVNLPEADISCFWLRVLKSSYTEFISKKDEQMLTHLIDIRSQLCIEPVVKFTLEFTFEPNPYFTNRVLTKTYFLNCLPDVDDPLTYDGAEIFKCEGCTINWKPGQQTDKGTDKGPRFQNLLSSYTTFFDFFDPPQLPEDINDPMYCDINAILQNDFELGFYLKERVIPKAILFFTGEIADCQSSDDSSDESDDNEDNEDEEASSGNEAPH